MKGQPQIGQSMIKGIGIGVAASMILTLLGAGVLTWLLLGGMMQESAMGYGVAAVLLVSSVIGGSIAVRIHGSQLLLTGALTAVAYGLCLLAVTALVFDGEYEGIPVTLPVLLSGGVAAALLGGRQKRSPLARRRKRRTG